MGGKAKGSNDQMIQFQREQAAEARAKEAARQARLEQGKTAIDALFQEGTFDPTYAKYKEAALNYNLPQLQDQYQKARDQTTYDLARSGTLRSSVAGTALADIESQKAMNEAGIRAQTESDLANLRQSVANNKQSAMAQLYSTEDPDVAANTATHMVQQAQLASPNLNPLGELFKPMIIGGTTALSNYLDNQNFTSEYNRRKAALAKVA